VHTKPVVNDTLRREHGGLRPLCYCTCVRCAPSTPVKTAMEEALTRILTPKRSIDILRDVRAAREAGRPYTIVFVGVNGVGKSTNLSKVAYWLLQHKVSVMIAACDTFRAGAVEQLRTHCNALGGDGNGRDAGSRPGSGGVGSRVQGLGSRGVGSRGVGSTL